MRTRGFWVLFVLGLICGVGCALPPPATGPDTLGETNEKTSVSGNYPPDGYLEALPPVPSKGYWLESLAEDVYFFSNGVYNNMFVVTSEGVVITDPIRGSGERLKQAIAEVTGQPVKYMIYSHSHLDHIGDAHLFQGPVKIIAHNETRRLLERYRDPDRLLPQISFGKTYKMDLGGVEFRLIYPGEGHGKGNIIIYLPGKRVLMFVDVATPKSVPFKNFSTVDIYGQVVGLKKALSLDFDIYVAGHLFRPGKKEEMREVLDYYYASRKANAEAMQRVPLRETLQNSPSKDIERKMGDYFQAVAEECYRILKKEWKPRLMGFEAFARGHCDTWTTFHRTHKTP